MNFCFSFHHSWSLHTHRFVFQSEDESQPTQAEATPRSPEAATQQENLLGADPERYFEERTGHILNLIDRFSGISPEVARQMTLQEQEQMGNLRQEYLSERNRLAAEQHPELQQAHQFHAENKKQAEQLMRDFFPGENPDMPAPWGGMASRTMLDLKEEYLSSLAPPQATDLQGVSPERISQINKILPMLLANQQALGIPDDMNIFEALMKVYTAPNAEALLHQDYQSVVDKLKDPHGPYYANVEPAYRWKESMDNRDEMVTRSSTSEDPDYKARKEQLSKMKPGDKLNVTFEGESYSFMLADSFQNHQYRFKLEEFPEMADFEINVVDLVDRTPEEQLQYMMGSSFRRATIEMEKLMQDLNLRLPEKRKALSLKREYPKGKLTKPLLERLPFSKEQIAFLTQFNTTHPLQLQLNTNKYDTITSLEVKWRNEEEKTNYYLSSVDGNYWRMHSLKDTSSKRTFLGYDLRTNELDAKIKKLA